MDISFHLYLTLYSILPFKLCGTAQDFLKQCLLSKLEGPTKQRGFCSSGSRGEENFTEHFLEHFGQSLGAIETKQTPRSIKPHAKKAHGDVHKSHTNQVSLACTNINV